MALMQDPSLRLVLSNGLQASFSPLDARKDCVRGTWPGAELQQSEERLRAAVVSLRRSLGSDTYEGCKQ